MTLKKGVEMKKYTYNKEIISEKEVNEQYYKKAIRVTNHFLFFDTEREMAQQERIIGFWKDTKIQNSFNTLSLREQKAIIHAIMKFTEPKECFGYNFRQMVEGICDEIQQNEKITTKVKNRAIARLLFNDEQCMDYTITSDSLDYTNSDKVSKDIDKYFKKNNFRTDERKRFHKLLELLCVYLGFSIDVLFDGRGEYYAVKEEYKDMENYWELVFDAWAQETQNCTSIREVNVEKILQVAGINFEKQYVVLKYSGCYQFLKYSKAVKPLEIINQLIEDLSSQYYSVLYPPFLHNRNRSYPK